jgi:hypothetical protein
VHAPVLWYVQSTSFKNRPCRFKKNLLKAAVVLSASLTFLSLPKGRFLADYGHGGHAAILFAVFSMAATVVAIFRHKADLERPISHIVGIEGMMVITVRYVILSLQKE